MTLSLRHEWFGPTLHRVLKRRCNVNLGRRWLWLLLLQISMVILVISMMVLIMFNDGVGEE